MIKNNQILFYLVKFQFGFLPYLIHMEFDSDQLLKEN